MAQDRWLERDIARAARWHRVWRWGRWRFVGYFGVVGFGLTLALILLLQDVVRYGWQLPVIRILFFLLLYPLAGVFLGLFMYAHEEGIYQRVRQTHEHKLTHYLAQQHEPLPLLNQSILRWFLPLLIGVLYLLTHGLVLSLRGILVSVLQLIVAFAGLRLMAMAYVRSEAQRK
jgi:hypothetical protein